LEDEKISYVGFSDYYGYKFKMHKKLTGESFFVGFDIRYYVSDTGNDDY